MSITVIKFQRVAAPLMAALVISSVGCAAPTEPSTAPSLVGRWHVDAAMRGSYTKMGATEQMLDRRMDLPLKLDWLHVFDEPYSPMDRRSDLGFGSWYAGVGRTENEHWLWTFYAGGGAAQDINHQRFLNALLKVDFRYAYYYTGVQAEYYPWRLPVIDKDTTWSGRIEASRPFLTAGIEAGYVSAEGEGDYNVTGVNLYHDEQKVRDILASLNLGAGWSLPISDHWSLNFSGDYRFHAYRPYEYDGWNWTTVIRYRF